MPGTVETFVEIPVVDLRRWRTGDSAGRTNFADELSRICHDVGFFVAVNHGIDRQLMDDAFAMMDRLFSLPDQVKATIDKRRSRHFRGWERIGSESTNNRPDLREQVDIWTEMDALPSNALPPYRRLIGPNQWLADEVLPGYRALTERWTAALQHVGDDILDILGLGLGLAEDHFADMFRRESMSLLKLIHYPPTPPGGAGVNGHHDTGFITILAPGSTPGLEVESPTGEWIAVPVISGSLVVNLGEMLQAITGNYYIATPHRVITSYERYSSGFFYGPNVDTPLRPLDLDPSYGAAVARSPRHSRAGFMAPVEELKAGAGEMAGDLRAATWGEQIWNYFVRSYPEIVRQHYPELVT